MKKIMCCLLLLTVFIACKDTSEQTEQVAAPEPQESAPDFSKLQFASEKDTSCGMPLSAGIEDTAMIDGKIYGFCSKDCKDDFLKTLQAKK